MTTPKKKPFSANLCIRALGNQLTYMHTDIYNFMYALTFSGSSGKKPGDVIGPISSNVYNNAIFTHSNNIYVRCLASIELTIMNAKIELCDQFTIDEYEDLHDQLIIEESRRFTPNYSHLTTAARQDTQLVHYADFLVGVMDCVHSYLRVFKNGGYELAAPVKNDKIAGAKLPPSWGLIQEESMEVRFVSQLMEGLMDDVLEYMRLVATRKNPAQYVRVILKS